jgi:hypothetical protein
LPLPQVVFVSVDPLAAIPVLVAHVLALSPLLVPNPGCGYRDFRDRPRVYRFIPPSIHAKGRPLFGEFCRWIAELQYFCAWRFVFMR